MIRIRVSEKERKAWDDAADKDDLKLSEWIRRRCNGQTVVDAAAPKLAR